MQTVYESVDGFSKGNEGACGDFITNDQPILNRSVFNDITVYVVDSWVSRQIFLISLIDY
jgi:hypothetical protein